jgi:hypothetical protein
LKGLTKKNAIDLYPKYFEAAYGKMKSFLISKPNFLVKYKKIIFSFLAVVFLGLAAFTYLTISQLQDTSSQLQNMEEERKQRQERRQQPRTFHWNGPDEEIAQILLEKLAEMEIQKTECSDRGIIVTPNAYSCRGREEGIVCSYSPRISFTGCDNRPISFIEKEGRFRSTPQQDSLTAKAELADELRKADFSDWISSIKERFR